MAADNTARALKAGRTRLKIALLLLWLLASFGSSWFARDLQTMLLGWPLNFWIASQGALLVFIAIVAVYAWLRNRQGDEPETPHED